MRQPKLTDLIDHVVRCQPELDIFAAAHILREDPEYRAWITRQWHLDRQFSEDLLTLHLLLEEKAQLMRQERQEAA